MLLSLPDKVKECLSTLENAGFQAFCVGGAVRDLIMGIIPSDYDVTTNASPDKVLALFEHTVPTGIKHGTVTVIIDGFSIEVTTYRSDCDYSGHRRPESVNFVESIDSDLIRRDFTVNAICCNIKGETYDPLGGIIDINNKIVRAVGDAGTRFTEDALRILRAFRFSAQLNFKIEKHTFDAALSCKELLKYISSERIFTELKKAVISPCPEKIKDLINSNALSFCGLKNLQFDNISKAVPNFPLRFALMCNNAHECETALRFLRSDKQTINDTLQYILLIREQMAYDRYLLKKSIRRYGVKKLNNYLLFKSNTENGFNEIKAEFIDIVESGEAYNINMLKINGNDIADTGVKGKDIGRALEYLLDAVMRDPKLNNKESLLQLLKDM